MKIRDLPKEHLEALAKPFCAEVLPNRKGDMSEVEELLDCWSECDFDSFYTVFVGREDRQGTAQVAQNIRAKLEAL